MNNREPQSANGPSETYFESLKGSTESIAKYLGPIFEKIEALRNDPSCDHPEVKKRIEGLETAAKEFQNEWIEHHEYNRVHMGKYPEGNAPGFAQKN